MSELLISICLAIEDVVADEAKIKKIYYELYESIAAEDDYIITDLCRASEIFLEVHEELQE